MKSGISIYIFLSVFCNGFGQSYDWFSLPDELNGAVTSLKVHNGKMIVAGGFTQIGDDMYKNIAAWDGSSWSALGTGYPSGNPSAIYDMVTHHDSLFAVGLEAATIGGVVIANKVIVWDGIDWAVLGLANDIINTIGIYNDEIYVGGKFDTINGVGAKGIAKWNGTTWENLGQGLRYNTYNTDVAELYVYNDLLFATGLIDSAGDVACKSIAYWDGNNWSNIPSLFSYVYFDSMIEWNGELLFGSLFAGGGTDLWVEIYSWDGTSFSLFSDQYMSNVYDFEIYDNNLYCAGLNGGADYGSTIRKWNGSNWVTVGTGVKEWTESLCAYNSELYVGGNFATTINSDHNYLARFAQLNSIDEINGNFFFAVYPIPIKSNATLEFHSLENSELEIDLIDSQGRLIKTFDNEITYTEGQQIQLDFTDIQSGIYFMRVEVNGEYLVEKIVKE